jgi:hypothetical protein
MAKFALKFLVTVSFLRRMHQRTDRVWVTATSSTLVTIVLVGLYLLQRGATG